MDPPQLSIYALNTTTPGYLTQRPSTYKRPFTHEGSYLVNLIRGIQHPYSISLHFSRQYDRPLLEPTFLPCSIM